LDLSGKATEEDEPYVHKPGKGARRTQKDKEENPDASRIYGRVDRSERAWERDMRGRLERVQARLVEVFEGRGDQELADVIREDGMAMIGGMIAACRPAAWLRAPVVTVMTVVEPLLAFGRVLRLLAGRWQERRIRLAEEREQAIAEWEQQQEPPEPQGDMSGLP